MNPEDRVRHLVETGAVAPDEAARLLAAIERPNERSFDRSVARLLINPFDRFGGEVAAIVGLGVALLSVLLARFGVRFDGFLDEHRSHGLGMLITVYDEFVSWILPAVLFWAAARMFVRHVRIVDFIGMVGVARLPLLLLAIPLAFIPLQDSPGHASATAARVLIVFALPCLAWALTLLYQGFKNASGLSGRKLVTVFIVMMVVSEIASKIILAKVDWS